MNKCFGKDVEIGPMYYFRAPWHRRWWAWFKRKVLRIKPIPCGIYTITEVVDSRDLRMED